MIYLNDRAAMSARLREIADAFDSGEIEAIFMSYFGGDTLRSGWYLDSEDVREKLVLSGLVKTDVAVFDSGIHADVQSLADKMSKEDD